MNRISHMVFAFALFVGLYSLIYGFSVWLSDLGTLSELLFYYTAGGIVLSIIAVPILYYKAPQRKMMARTISDRGSVVAMTFVVFCIGSLVGSIIYQWQTGVSIIGNISIFIGALITMAGALMPDWDIPFLGISRHRNIIFHSLVLPLLIVLGTLVNVTSRILSATSLAVGAEIEYYITALFLLGYASHLYLDIYPSNANPLEILWTAIDIDHKAPTGLKPLGPIKISQKNARNWLVGNATFLIGIAFALFALYFYNILA
ncbi:MAG: metal-dependent hydrolase [Candidatus Thorarchaeota archaeon]|nr:metal-dependent hydrolase [Candidatus Thorarchaeota archaeon]